MQVKLKKTLYKFYIFLDNIYLPVLDISLGASEDLCGWYFPKSGNKTGFQHIVELFPEFISVYFVSAFGAAVSSAL